MRTRISNASICAPALEVPLLRLSAPLRSRVSRFQALPVPSHEHASRSPEVGNEGLTLAESRAHFSLWCMLAAPLMAGNDVRKMTPEIRAFFTVKDVIAIDQDVLGKEGWRFRAETGREIRVRELSGGEWAVCLLNTGATAAELHIDFPSMRLFGRKFSIRDVWTKKDAGTTERICTARIESHDVALLRLAPLK